MIRPLRAELDASSKQIEALQISLQRVSTAHENAIKQVDDARTSAQEQVLAAKAGAAAEVQAAHSTCRDELDAAREANRLELEKIREQAQVDIAAANRATNVAMDMHAMAEERVREVKRWVTQEHGGFARQIQRLNDEVAAKHREALRLHELLRVHNERLKKEHLQLQITEKQRAEEKARAEEDALRKQQVVDALENTTESMEEENARLKKLLAETSAHAEDLSRRLEVAEKTRDEADAAAKAHYENVFLVNEWKQFNDAYKAFESGMRQVRRERDDTRSELEALRRRLRESKHLPHLGIKWVMWGKDNHKPASVAPAPSAGELPRQDRATLQVTKMARSQSTPSLQHRTAPQLPSRPRR